LYFLFQTWNATVQHYCRTSANSRRMLSIYRQHCLRRTHYAVPELTAAKSNWVNKHLQLSVAVRSVSFCVYCSVLLPPLDNIRAVMSHHHIFCGFYTVLTDVGNDYVNTVSFFFLWYCCVWESSGMYPVPRIKSCSCKILEFLLFKVICNSKNVGIFKGNPNYCWLWNVVVSVLYCKSVLNVLRHCKAGVCGKWKLKGSQLVQVYVR